MRKFSARWWLALPKFPKEIGAHSHQPGVISVGFCMACVMGVPAYPAPREATEADLLWNAYFNSTPATSVQVIG